MFIYFQFNSNRHLMAGKQVLHNP
jgi:hypothetical protein